MIAVAHEERVVGHIPLMAVSKYVNVSLPGSSLETEVTGKRVN